MSARDRLAIVLVAVFLLLLGQAPAQPPAPVFLPLVARHAPQIELVLPTLPPPPPCPTPTPEAWPAP